jgi:hypothetical protein
MRDEILKDMDTFIAASYHENGDTYPTHMLIGIREHFAKKPTPEASELATMAKYWESAAKVAADPVGAYECIDVLADALEAAESRCERYKEALEWMTVRGNWSFMPDEVVAKARAALQETGEKP